jgi:asparagine synthase (glutamine-hydrolysing)
MRRWREKAVLRRAMTGVLPPEIAWREKRPMRPPYDPWRGADLPAFAREELSPARLREAGYFDPTAVATALQRHLARAEHLDQALTAVLVVQLWDRQFRGGRLERPA